MKHKGYTIIIEKVSGWVATVESPNGSTLEIHGVDGIPISETKKGAAQEAREIIDELTSNKIPEL